MKSLRGAARRPLTTALLLSALVVVTVPALAGPDDRLERVERKQDRVTRKLEQVRARGDEIAATVAALDRERARFEATVEGLDRRIGRVDAAIARVERRLVEARRHLLFLGERLDVIEARLEEREDLYRERAVSAYVAGPATAMDTLLTSEDLSDLLDRFTYYESALDADSRLIEQIELLADEVTVQREEVERKRQQIAGDKAALEDHRAAVAQIRDRKAEALAAQEAAVAAKRSLLADVRLRGSRLERIEQQLARESGRIEVLLAQQAAGVSGSAPGGSGQLAWPAGGPVTSGFGLRVHPLFGDRRMHTGIDIAAPYGAAVWAAAGGSVTYAGTMSGYGNVVILDHGGGLATTYNHLSASSVARGQTVGRGQPIASVGCTGYCTGPHLHFEVRVNGVPVDPLPYLR